LSAYTERAIFAKYRSKKFKEVHFETEGPELKKRKATVAEKISKLIKTKNEQPNHEIEKMADIQVSKPLFARQLNGIGDTCLLTDVPTTKKPSTLL
jgi:hypothetical protein